MQVVGYLEDCRSGYLGKTKNCTEIGKVNPKIFRKLVKRYAPPSTFFFYNLLCSGNWHGKGKYIFCLG